MLQKPSEKAVFLDLPYDRQFSNLCLAYIAGIACYGLTARATLKSEMANILKASNAGSIFDGARTFRDVYLAAALKADKRV